MFYWRLSAIPDIQLVPPAERAPLVRRTVRQHLTERRRLLLSLPSFIGLAVGYYLAGLIFPTENWTRLVGIGLGTWCGATVGQHLQIKAVMPFITEEVARSSRKPSI